MPDQRGAESPEMYRWQGGVDVRLDSHEKRLDVINGDAKAARIASEDTQIQLAVLKTKVAIWSALGGVGGAGVVSLVVQLVAHR